MCGAAALARRNYPCAFHTFQTLPVLEEKITGEVQNLPKAALPFVWKTVHVVCVYQTTWFTESIFICSLDWERELPVGLHNTIEPCALQVTKRLWFHFIPHWESGFLALFSHWGTWWRQFKVSSVSQPRSGHWDYRAAGFFLRLHGLSWIPISVTVTVSPTNLLPCSHICNSGTEGTEEKVYKTGMGSVLELVMFFRGRSPVLGIAAAVLTRLLKRCVCLDLKLARFHFFKNICNWLCSWRSFNKVWQESAWVLKISIKRGNLCPLDYPIHACKSTHTACFIATTKPAEEQYVMWAEATTPPLLQHSFPV